MGCDRKYCKEARKLHSAATAAVEFPYPFPVCLVSSSSSTTTVLVIATTTYLYKPVNTLAPGSCSLQYYIIAR